MQIKQAILHIIDRDANQLICSQAKLDLDEFAVGQYLESVSKRIEKGEYKYGDLNSSSDFVTHIKATQEDFITSSQVIAQMIFDSLAISEDAPSGDLLVFEGETTSGETKIGLIKFNYKPSFTHHVTYADDVMQNNIILNKTIFPAVTQKIDECVLVNPNSLVAEIIEKKYSFEGEKRFFFTERFLQIDPTPTVSENLKIVKKAVKEVSERYNEEEYISMSQTQQAIFESIEEEGKINPEKIADAVFKNNHTAKEEYLNIVSQTKFSEEIPSNIPKYEKKYSKQKFKLANGIELSIPSEVYNDTNTIEFINNADGTVSVMIKNIEDIISKF